MVVVRMSFMFPTPLLLLIVVVRRAGGDDRLRTIDDSRGDEDEQLGAVIRNRLLLEEPSEDRDLREVWNLIERFRVLAGVDAADDGGVAVLDEHLGAGLAAADRRLAVRAGELRVRLVVGDVHAHLDRAFLRDVRGYPELEAGLDEGRVYAPGAGLRVRDRHALSDGRLDTVEGDRAGRADGLDGAAVLRRGQAQIELGRSAGAAEDEADAAAVVEADRSGHVDREVRHAHAEEAAERRRRI